MDQEDVHTREGPNPHTLLFFLLLLSYWLEKITIIEQLLYVFFIEKPYNQKVGISKHFKVQDKAPHVSELWWSLSTLDLALLPDMGVNDIC